MRLSRVLAALSLSLLFVSASCPRSAPTGLVLYAQTVPATLHASWSPNAPTDNVISYTVQLDAAPPVTVLPSACSATECLASITVPTFGSHTATVIAQNRSLSTDPTSIQNSPPSTVAFALSPPPGAVSNATIKP